LRIFIGLREVSGFNVRLNQGFQALGIPSTFISLQEHPFGYDSNKAGILVKAIQFCVKRYQTGKLLKSVWGLLQLLLSVPLLIWAAASYDVFIFGFGTSFLLLYDLPVLKLLGKKIIFLFYGSDARPPYLNGMFIKDGGELNIKQCIRAAQAMKRRIDRIEQYADAILSHPPYGLFYTKPFVMNAIVGFPYSASAMSQNKKQRSDVDSVRILHAPSKRSVKGTDEIEAAIERLRLKGHKLEWVTISGQPNAVVLQELLLCDFVVDQLYSDWLMPGFATEAAFVGKPTIIAGYELQSLGEFIPIEFLPPVHVCHPDDIEEAIEKLIVDVPFRRDLGRRAQAFVESNWSAAKVAERFLKIIQQEVPNNWMFDPAECRYFRGLGVPEERLRSFLRAYIERGGSDALQLSDKPELQQRFIDFAVAQVSPE
jgi:glycosyltransferase involved in cell wall biosynthesis